MNANDSSSDPLPDAVATPGSEPADAAAPKRRTRKPAVVAETAVAEAAATTVEIQAAEPAAAEPKAPRRRKPKAEPDVAELGPVDAVAATEADPMPRERPAAPADVEAAPVAADPQDEAASGEAPADGAESGRRGRNRRRGRGKDRADRVQADGQLAEGEASEAREPRPAREPAVLPDPAEAVERFAEVLSGAYDAEAPEPDDEAALEQQTKRVLRPEPEAPKLHKVLAQSGIGSRRDMEQLILDGGVTVNDEVAHIGMRISHGDRVKVSGKPVKVRIQGAPARLLAYHKPTGEVVSFNDPEGRPTVFRRLPRLENSKWQSVGRLDINTEGLLLFTNAGELANQLMHPRFGVEREYAVRVLGSLEPEQRERLIEGVEIDGQTANFKSIEDGGGEGANRWYRVVITEGRNREVRKLFDKVGLAVSRLIRIRYGSVVLPRGLKRGVWVELGEHDLRVIRQTLGGAPRGEAREAAPAQPQRQDRQERRPQPNGRGPKPAGKGQGRGPQQGAPRGERVPLERPPRRERDERPPAEPGADGEDFGPIPNPLEQTFDRRFAKGSPRRGASQGFGHGRVEQDLGLPPGTIPNPLEQTFDKRFVKGSQRINAGFGRPDGDPHGGPAAGGKKGGPKQPDPMQTSVGYIGADAYFNKVGGKRSGGGGGGGGRGGSGGPGRRGR